LSPQGARALVKHPIKTKLSEKELAFVYQKIKLELPVTRLVHAQEISKQEKIKMKRQLKTLRNLNPCKSKQDIKRKLIKIAMCRGRQIRGTLRKGPTLCIMTDGESNASLWTSMSILSPMVRYPYSVRPPIDNCFATSSKDPQSKPKAVRTGPGFSQTEPDKRFEGVRSEISQDMVFDDSREISVTYLGHQTKFDQKPEERFNIDIESTATFSSYGGISGRLLCDSGATKCYMPKHYYLTHPILHQLPKYQTVAKGVIVGNGQQMSVLFAIPLIIAVQGHRFELMAIVAELHGNFDLVWGMKTMIELESVIDVRNSELRFLNRSVLLYPMQEQSVKNGLLKDVQICMHTKEEISGYVICKLYDGDLTTTIKLKFVRGIAVINIQTKQLNQVLKLDPTAPLGVADLRSIGYFHVSGKTIYEALKDEMTLIDAHQTCDQFNRLVHAEKLRTKMSSPEQYPWLEDDDWRKSASDEEILRKQIDLSNSHLSKQEKEDLMDLCLKHKEAFSLRDEVGECPYIRVHIELHDKTPFFVRPFPAKEENKPLIDRQMERYVMLGVLSQHSTSHTSPIMLLSRKLTQDKRVVVDFRQLNSRVIRRNTTTPLMRDILTTLGKHPVEIFSCIDFKDAYHSMRLDEESKEYCGIVPYFGAPCYRFERLPMGLSISPAMWMEYVSILLDNLPHKDKYLAIMDDLLLYSKRKHHWQLIEDLLMAVIHHGLKISPKKCQFFVKEMIYMGNLFKLMGTRIEVTPLKSRCEAIIKLPPPNSVKGCRMFCGMVNYLAMFCKDLSRILKPIYQLTRKGIPFSWGKEQQQAFVQIKKILISPPVLALPTAHGRYTLYTDTSRTHVGTALWQTQDGKPRLIGYASKTLPEAAKNYTVTELEMVGLITGLDIWSHFVDKREIDVVTDHQAAVYIMKAKKQPATEKIAKLIEKIQAKGIKLYYVKGKDLVLADSLSRLDIPDSEGPAQLLPVAVTPEDFKQVDYTQPELSQVEEEILQDKDIMAKAFPPRYDLETNRPNLSKKWNRALLTAAIDPQERCLVLTRRKAAAQGISLPAVHGVAKALDPSKRPEKDRNKPPAPTPVPTLPAKAATPRPPTPNPQPDSVIPQIQDERPALSDVQENQRDIDHREAPKEFTESSDPWLERIRQKFEEYKETPFDLQAPADVNQVVPQYQLPLPRDFREPLALAEQVDLTNVVQRRLPRQIDLDKVLKQIQRKILHQVHVTEELKDIKAHYQASPHFKQIHQYLSTGRATGSSPQVRQTIAQSVNYFLLDELLFRLHKDSKGDWRGLLCLPSSLLPQILSLYHSSLFGSHMGISKSIATLSQRFYCPEMAKQVRAYILGCHTCQTFKDNKKRHGNPLNQRVTLETPALTRISMDIKHMPPGLNGYNFILVLCCEMSNYIIACPLKQTRAPEICVNIVKSLIAPFGVPEIIISDQDPAFLSSLMQYFYQQFEIKLVVCGPTNHKSLKAESAIKTLSTALMKHLTEKGIQWPLYLPFSVLSCNSFHTPNLNGFAPIQLVLGRLPKLIPQIEISPEIMVSKTFEEYIRHSVISWRI